MKSTILLLLTTLHLFAYTDCCEMIGKDFNPEEIQQGSNCSAYDYLSGQNEFIDFSADKISHYSNTRNCNNQSSSGTPPMESAVTTSTTRQRLIPLNPTDNKELEKMVEEETTVK